jgi:hypothetical protein
MFKIGFTIAFFMAACVPSINTSNSPSRRPRPEVMAAASRIIQQRLGDSLFAAMVAPLPDETAFHPAVPGCSDSCLWPWRTAYFVLFFSLRPSNSSMPSGLIAVPLDTSGAPIPGFPPYGAPSCGAQPSECSFPISEDSARTIAKAAGLPQGIKPWSVRFLWLEAPNVGSCEICEDHFLYHYHSGFPTYGWEARSITDTTNYSANGWVFLIDANDGAIISRSPWSVIE